ncbi:MAG: hypothetical protein ACOYL9_00520 [Ilumatobacteraceae bacterium]
MPIVPGAWDVTTEIDAGAARGRKRSRGATMGALVGVTAIVAAGAFAVVSITGNDSGGAASPTELGVALTEALNREDILGVLDLTLPSEREVVRQPLIDLVDNLSRTGVFDDSASLGKLGGVDFSFTDVSARSEPTTDPTISNVFLSGSSTVSVDGKTLPLGSLLVDTIFEGQRPDMDVAPTSSEFEDTRLTTVERDGRWYLSAFYSIAESARGDADLPAEGVAAVGADTPEGAVSGLIQAVSDQDLRAFIGVLDPSEAEALQRYAPLFLDEAQQAIDDLGIEWSVTDVKLGAEGSGDRRHVTVTALKFQGTIEDSTIGLSFADGCVSTDIDGTTNEVCGNDSAAFDEILGDADVEVSAELKQFSETVSSAFADFDPRGIAVHEVDGKWYVSPIRSYLDAVNDVLAALDQNELTSIVTSFRALIDSEDFGLGGLPFGDPLFGTGDAFSDEPMTSDPISKCYGIFDAPEALACIQAAIDAGTGDPATLPVTIRYPECGVAEFYWSGVYSASDADFVATVTAASPCFLDLVASGAVDVNEVPGELRKPECVEGRNWYTATDSDYNQRVSDCFFAELLAP